MKYTYYKTRDWIRKDYPHVYMYLYTVGNLECYIKEITKSLNKFNSTNIVIWKAILNVYNKQDYSFKDYHDKFIRDSLAYRINWNKPILYKILKKRKSLDRFVDNCIKEHINYLQLDPKSILKYRLILTHPWSAFNPEHTPEGKKILV